MSQWGKSLTFYHAVTSPEHLRGKLSLKLKLFTFYIGFFLFMRKVGSQALDISDASFNSVHFRDNGFRATTYGQTYAHECVAILSIFKLQTQQKTRNKKRDVALCSVGMGLPIFKDEVHNSYQLLSYRPEGPKNSYFFGLILFRFIWLLYHDNFCYIPGPFFLFVIQCYIEAITITLDPEKYQT